VSGEISAAGARRLPALLDRYQPALLLLCHGGNDFLRHLDPAATEANIRAMVAAARERGVPVLLIGVPKPGLLLRSPDFYRRIAQAYRLPYDGDTLAGILADRRLKSDAVHPNAEGYRRLAEAVRRLMQAAGALR
jgi:lysophospholipase L1-like esterase